MHMCRDLRLGRRGRHRAASGEGKRNTHDLGVFYIEQFAVLTRLRHRLREPLEPRCAKVAKLEQIADKLTRPPADYHGVRIDHSLQTSGKVRRFTNDLVLLSLATLDEITYNDQSGLYSDAGLERTGRQLQPINDIEEG